MSDGFLADLVAEQMAPGGNDTNDTPNTDADLSSDGSEGSDQEENENDDAGSETESDAGDDAGEDKGDDEGDAGDDENNDESEGDKGGKRKSGSARLRERLQRAETELRDLRSKSAPANDTPEALEAAVVDRIGPKPTEADFNGDYLAYERASIAWESARLTTLPVVKDAAKAAASSHTDAIADKIEDFQDRRAKAAKAIPDFDATLKGATIELKPNVTLEILESDRGELIAYHIAKNPKLADKLNGASPRELVREIAKLESTLSYPKPKTQTSASTPPRSPRGGAAPKSQDDVLNGWLDRKYGKRG